MELKFSASCFSVIGDGLYKPLVAFCCFVAISSVVATPVWLRAAGNSGGGGGEGREVEDVTTNAFDDLDALDNHRSDFC